MNCIWILLLLFCCNGNGCCGNMSRSCDQNCDNDYDDARSGRDYDRNSCDRDSYERSSYERSERDCSCEDNYSSRTERIVPPLRSDYSTYGRSDRRDDDYNRRSDDYDRRDKRCETCGCEAE